VFELKIFLPTYSHAEVITPTSEKNERASKAVLETTLSSWFEKSNVSGFGDVRALETRVDVSVRSAREIPADAFSVPPNLLSELESIWANAFYPSRVRAEPYKVHLYGPSGFFEPHRDTPQTGLVGTMLVGLGDTKSSAALYVGKQTGYWRDSFAATRGSWVAFYPDVAHKVVAVKDGFRAVVAFKMFAVSDDTLSLKRKRGEDHPSPAFQAPTPVFSTIQTKVANALSKIPAPFGLLLAHKYCIGTQQPSGFDAALLEAAKTLPARDSYLLPVVVEMSGLSADWFRAKDRRTSSKVYPLTSAHVSAIIAGTREHIDQSGPKDEAYLSRRPRYDRASVELVGTDAEWIAARDVQDIPFYSLDHTTDTLRWKHERHEEDYTGNESSGIREDSLYLSYAIVILEQQRVDAQSEQDPSVSS
jgi:hypothetical protein